MQTALGREKHACGVIKRLADDHRLLFYTGGTIVRSSLSYLSSYTTSTSYNAFYWDLTDNTGWTSFPGAYNTQDMEFVKISPYEGYIFNWSPSLSLTNWHVWDEHSFKFYRSTQERLSLREDFTVAGIPKSSPFLTNCFE